MLFGDAAVEQSLDFNSAGLAEAFPFINKNTGTATSISVYVDARNKATSLIAGLYSDASGSPGAKIAAGSISRPRSGAWNTVSLLPTGVTSGATYWVAILGNGGGLYFRDRSNGPCSSQNSKSNSLTTLASTWVGGRRWSTCPISASVNGIQAAPTLGLLAPTNTAAPVINGTPTEGQTMTTSNGSWNNLPTAYSYQWEDCDSAGANCVAISGATSSSYTLTSSDVAGTVRAAVTASNLLGSGTATSDATGMVTPLAPLNIALPTVSGTALQGQVMTTSNGSWSGSPTSYTYQWKACDSSGNNCTNVSGAAANSYTLTANDVSRTMRATVTATNAGGSTSATSTQTATVASGAPPPSLSPPSNTAVPTVSGTATQGQVMTTSNGSWSGSPTSYTYQWRDCDTSGNNCANISGATSSSYTLAAGDVGHTVRIVVTATNSSGSTPAVSVQTAVVAASTSSPPTNSAAPAISGTPTQGQTLSTSNGSWTGSPISYSYQWRDCDTSGASCINISGATGSTYTLTSNEVGETLRVVVTASNGGGSTPATSAQTAVIQATANPPTNTAQPAISGTAIQGQRLTTSNGSWTGSPTSYAYQWEDCDTSGNSCSGITGATSSTYTPAANDVGDTIRAVVTASNASGSASANSPASATVASSGGGGATQTLNCFSSPGACGYPDPRYGNVGVPAGTTLTPSGDLVITKAGTVINGLNISGPAPVVQIEANNVTIENSKITATGGGCGSQSTCGNQIVAISHNGGTFYTGTHLTHDELTTGNGTTIEYAIHCACGGGQASTELDHLYVHGVDGALWTYGGGYLHDNYFTSEEFIANDHLEDIYCPGNEVSDLTVVHDTQLNTNNSVASGVFCDTNGGSGGKCSSHITMKNNLLAGGGYAIYACGNASSVGSSTLDFENNDLARCTTTPIAQASDGGFDCQGSKGTAPGSGADSHGYWPYGGHYGIDAFTWCPGTAGQVWSGNFWDDNGATVSC